MELQRQLQQEQEKRPACKVPKTQLLLMIHTVVVYQEEAEEGELWVGCDVCDKWYCGYCENFSLPPDVDIYICTVCRQ